LAFKANFRIVDSSQYQSRMNTFDFDIATQRYVLSLTLGEEVARYWSSADADTEGSPNLAGIADPVIDALIAKDHGRRNPRGAGDCRTRHRPGVARGTLLGAALVQGQPFTVAYWDIYDRPETKPDYTLGANQTWWYDSDKAARIGHRRLRRA
jgi:microcin C transport system substrate-binding protein